VFFGFDIFVLVIVVLAILTLFAGVKTVPQGFNWTVERFGKYTNTLRPGLNLIVPYFDRIGRKMNMMEQAIDIPEQDVITKDNATVTVDGLAFFQLIDAAKASYEIANLDQAIVKLIASYAEDVELILDRCGLEPFTATPGESFRLGEHSVVATIETTTQGCENTIAEVTAIGFRERVSGQVKRPVRAKFYCLPEPSGPSRAD